METYAIPAQNLPELRQKIERLDRRARKLGSAPIGLLVKRSYFDERVVDMRKRAIKFYEVAISGEAPKLAGWEFLARIDMAQRVIFSVPGTDELPERFRESNDGRCDHCGTRRQRKAVFVVRNEAGEFKQVGRNCLRDFLGHQNPEAVARMLEYLWRAVRACEGGDEGWAGASMPEWDSADLVLALTSAVIRQHGWVSRGTAREDWNGSRATADRVGVQLHGPTSFTDRTKDDPIEPSEADYAEAGEALKWVAEVIAKQDQLSQYEHNLIAALEHGWVDWQTLGLACSAIPGYQRHMGRLRERKARESAPPSRHFGEPGRREVFTLTLLGVFARESDWGTTHIHRFADAAGNLAIWFASSESDMDEGKTYEVKATVKRHGDFAGKAQTILSRAAMVREIPTAA